MSELKKVDSPHWALWEAIAAGDCDLLTEILECNDIVNDSLANELTPLSWAIHNQKSKVVEQLLKKEADVNIPVSHKTAAAIPWLRNNLSLGAPNVYPLQIAASTQNTEIIELLLDNRASFDQCNGGVNGLLHIAVTQDCPGLVSKLVKLAQQNDLSTIITSHLDLTEHIIVAIQRKNIKMLNHLIDLGANVNKEHNGLTPIVLASNNEDLRMCFALLNSGASVNDCGITIGAPQTPLSIAIKGGLTKAVRILLRLGSDPNSILDWSSAGVHNTFGIRGATLPARSSMLHLAVAKQSLDMMKMLINAGARVDQKNSIGETPLHQVLRCSQDDRSVEMVKLLLSKGNDNGTTDKHPAISINVQNSQGETPLILAVASKNTELVKLLIDFGANLEIVDKQQYGPMHHAVLQDNEENLLALVRANAEVDGPRTSVKNCQFVTPLHLAVQNGNIMFTDILTDLGADISLLNSHGENLIHLAVMSKNCELVEHILKKKLPVDKKTALGETPLMMAARQDSSLVCQALIDHGAKLNETDRNKETALLLSVYFGFEVNAKVLILEGADVNRADKRKTTPIYWSIYNNRLSTLKLLILAGAKFSKRDLLRFPRNLTVMKHEELFQWMIDFVSGVRSLEEQCRFTIRRSLCSHDGCGIGRLVSKLPLPTKLQYYLMSFDASVSTDYVYI